MGAQSLVEDLADLIRRPITLEDSTGRLIAYSVHDVPVDSVRLETLLRKGASLATIETLKNRGVYDLIDSTAGIALVPGIPEIGFEPRVAVAVREGTEVLGYLWVLYGYLPVSEAARVAILRSARMLGEHLGTLLKEETVKPDERVELVKDLVGGVLDDDTAIGSRARGAEWRAKPQFQAVVVRPQKAAGVSAVWCLREVQAAVPIDARFCLAGVVGEDGVLILSGRDPDPLPELRQRISSRFSDDRRFLGTVGAGGLCESAVDIQKSYRQAVRAAILGPKIDPGSVVFEYRSLAAYDLLSCMAGCSMCGSYGRQQIEKLKAYDKMHGHNLLPTLEAYLDWYGSRKRAALRLNVHPNTMDYRIRKISELIDVDLDCPSVRLALHVWIKALAVVGQEL